MNLFLKIVSVTICINFKDVGMQKWLQVQFTTGSPLPIDARFHQHHGHLLSLLAFCSLWLWVFTVSPLLLLSLLPPFCIYQQMFTLLCAPECGYSLGWSSFPQGNQNSCNKKMGAAESQIKHLSFPLLKVQQHQHILPVLNSLGLVI